MPARGPLLGPLVALVVAGAAALGDAFLAPLGPPAVPAPRRAVSSALARPLQPGPRPVTPLSHLVFIGERGVLRRLAVQGRREPALTALGEASKDGAPSGPDARNTEGPVSPERIERPSHPERRFAAAEASRGRQKPSLEAVANADAGEKASPVSDASAPARKEGKKRSESQLRWASRVATGVLLPSQLKYFRNLTELLAALQPSREAASRGELDGGNAAIAMNHIKRLAAGGRQRAGGRDAGGESEVSEFLCAYALAVERSAHNMTGKHLSLAVNALAANYNGVPGAAAGTKDALRRLVQPLTLRIAQGQATGEAALQVRSLAVRSTQSLLTCVPSGCASPPCRMSLLSSGEEEASRRGSCRTLAPGSHSGVCALRAMHTLRRVLPGAGAPSKAALCLTRSLAPS